jgi:hypothetical protein
MGISQYFFNRFYVHEEPWSDMSRMKNWDIIKVLKGDKGDIRHSFNEKIYNKWLRRILDYLGIDISKITYAGMIACAIAAEYLGILEEEVSQIYAL